MADTRKNILEDEDPARAFLRISDQFRAASAEEREVMRAHYNFGRNWSPWISTTDAHHFQIPRYFQQLQQELPDFTIQQWIDAAISSFAIHGVSEDFRDDLVSICLTYHTALQSDIDVTKLFAKAIDLSQDKMAIFFGTWMKRKPKNKSLYAMGHRKAPHYDGIAYEWIGTSENYEAMRPIKLDKWGQILVASPTDKEQISVHEMRIIAAQRPLIQDHSYDSWMEKMREQALNKARKMQ